MTLANAVAELLDRGLQATADAGSVAELERQVSQMSSELQTLRQRDQATSSAYRALAQRTAQPIGICPSCGAPVSGRDLLVVGSCGQDGCGASLAPLLDYLSPNPELAGGGLNDSEFKLLLGALGLALGIAFITQQAGGG